MQRTIAEVRAEAFREHAAVVAAARLAAERCRDELGASAVYLFGSRARNDWLQGSDCDLLVVSDAFEGMPFNDRWLAVFDRWEGPVDIEPIGVTRDEFERGRRGMGIVAMAFADGVIDLLETGADSRQPPPRLLCADGGAP